MHFFSWKILPRCSEDLAVLLLLGQMVFIVHQFFHNFILALSVPVFLFFFFFPERRVCL